MTCSEVSPPRCRVAVWPASCSGCSMSQLPVPHTAGPPGEGGSRPLLLGSVTVHPGWDGLGKEATWEPRAAPAGSEQRGQDQGGHRGGVPGGAGRRTLLSPVTPGSHLEVWAASDKAGFMEGEGEGLRGQVQGPWAAEE